MSLNSWLKSLKQSPRSRNRKSAVRELRRTHHRRLFLEGLEERALLTGVVFQGHTYEFIADYNFQSFEDVQAAAENMTYLGVPGHLATITSQAENDFLYDTFRSQVLAEADAHSDNYPQAWVGGYSPTESTNPSSGWEWITGETWGYTFWRGNEPGGFPGFTSSAVNMDFASPNRPGSVDGWNDVPPTWHNIEGYIVEWDIAASATLTIGDASVTEGESGPTTLSFPVTLSHAVGSNVSVDYVTQDGTAEDGDPATEDNDYIGVTTPATFTLLAGQTSGSIDITVNGDTTVELDETLSLIVSNLQANGEDVQLDGQPIGTPTFLNFSGGGGTLPDGTTYTITGNQFVADGNGFSYFDGGNVDITFSNPVNFQVLPAQGASGYWNNPADGTQAFDVVGGTLSLTADPDDEIAAISGDGTDHLEIDFRWSGNLSPSNPNGPGPNGNDYLPAFQDWIIDGSTTSTLSITDTEAVPTNTTGFAVAVIPIVATATGTIENDDSATLSIGNASVTEGDSGPTVLSLPVTLSQPVDGNVSVDYVTQDGTAQDGDPATEDNDYVGVTTPATFTLLAGENAGTIDITVNGDTTVEPDETLRLIADNLQAGGHDVTLVSAACNEVNAAGTGAGGFNAYAGLYGVLNTFMPSPVVTTISDFAVGETINFRLQGQGHFPATWTLKNGNGNTVSSWTYRPPGPNQDFAEDVSYTVTGVNNDTTLTQTLSAPNGGITSYYPAGSNPFGVTCTTSVPVGTIVNDDFNTPPDPAVDVDLTPNEVAEGAADGTTVGVTAEANDAEDTLVYTLTNDASGRFAIDSSSGVVTVAVGGSALLNYEDDTSHLITVQAEDPSGETSTADFTINVTNVSPSIPVDDDGTVNAIDEGATGTVGIDVSSTDPNGTAGGVLPATQTFTVFGGSAYDADEAVMNATLGVTGFIIEDFEDATLIPGLSRTPIGGTNLGIGGPIGAARIWDGTQMAVAHWPNGPTHSVFNFDPASSFGIGISDEEGVVLGGTLLFRVNGTGPWINLHSLANYDISTATTQDIRNGYLRIDQGAGDPPITSVAFRSTATDDGILFDHLALKPAATGPGNVTFSLSDDAGGRFQIDANTGVVTVADATKLNYEDATSHDITVVADDGSGAFSDTNLLTNGGFENPTAPTGSFTLLTLLGRV